MAADFSPLDEKAFALNGVNRISAGEITPANITSNSGRLHALEQIEVLPKILQEGILFAGSGTALLLQAAMPGIREEGIAGGPDALASELLDAMQAHISYISCLVFGTRDERNRLLDLLHQGRMPLLGGGRNNRFVHHRDQQLWMAATLYATSTDFFQRVYGRVDYPTAQRAFSEYTLLMNCLGVPSDLWPESREAFWNYWDAQINTLTVSSDAARFAKDLRETADLPRWVQHIKPFIRVATIEMLPPRLRDAYGLRSTASTRALYNTWIGFSKALYPAMPDKWRSFPVRYYQDLLRDQMGMV